VLKHKSGSHDQSLNFPFYFFSAIPESIYAMYDVGLIDYWKNCSPRTVTHNCEPTNIKMGMSNQKKKPISLDNLSGAFVVLAVGIAAASFAFVIEIWIAIVQRMKSRH
jgi:membrane-bound inhibitor of C-type lysozyme